MATKNAAEILTDIVRSAGRTLLRHFGKIRHIRQKEHVSSVVCEADLASEKLIVRRLRSAYPDSNLITEESGYVSNGSALTWVVDPLDGTSNFVAGLPWFGVQVGLLAGNKPVLAAMYLPLEEVLYLSEAGGGVLRNGKRVHVSSETQLKRVLCAFGFDSTADQAQLRQDTNLLMKLAGGVRNTRATNSLFDFCYTVDGRLGGCVNLNCKIWDIVPVSLMLPEAGGIFTDLRGQPIVFDLDQRTFGRSYAVLGAARRLHPRFVRRLWVESCYGRRTSI